MKEQQKSELEKISEMFRIQNRIRNKIIFKKRNKIIFFFRKWLQTKRNTGLNKYPCDLREKKPKV